MSVSSPTYPTIRSVTPLENYRLRVTFTNHVTKVYDCSEILQYPAFAVLHERALFREVHVDQGGYGVFWNDAIDLSESELWLHGKTIDETSELSRNTQGKTQEPQRIPA